MTPELLTELGKGYRLRHTVQRRIEYGLLICLFGGVIQVVQHFTTQNVRPLSLSVLAVAVFVAASAWPVAIKYQASERRVRWLRAKEDRTQRILPNAPDAFDTPPPGSRPNARRAAVR